MSNKEYSKEQIELLKTNKFVKDCTLKYITFTDEFKIEVMKLDNKWVYFRDIFRHFWFPEFIITSNIPKQNLKNWRRNIKADWLPWLLSSKKWRKKWKKIDLESMPLEERIKYLEIENTYLKELHKVAYWHYP